jgi:succinate dehydrogenase / fumarate reductase membrane anchor subunit
MSLRSPLGQVLGLGSAKEGTGHFWGQRVSGVALALLGMWFVYSMLMMPGFTHADATAFIGAPVNSVLLLLLVSTVAYHSYLGIQVVVEDYVHGHTLKLVSLLLSRFAHAIVGVAAVFAIVKIGLGT